GCRPREGEDRHAVSSRCVAHDSTSERLVTMGPHFRGDDKGGNSGKRESHHAVFANRSVFRAIGRTPEPGPAGSLSTPFATSRPSNGSSSTRSNSASSQA